MTELTFVGTGEAVDPDVPNTSVLYRGGRTLLMDCGYSVPQALWKLSHDPALLDAIYISHRHADHCFGLPALLLWMHEAGRTAPLTLLGGVGLEMWLEHLFDTAYPGLLSKRGAFELRLLEVAPGKMHSLGPLSLKTAASRHSEENLALRIEEQGMAVCYSGDGAPTDETRALYAGAESLVHECYGAEPVSENHADLGTLLDIAEQAGVGTLYLVHLGRDQKQPIHDAVARYHGPAAVCLPQTGETIPLAR